VDFDQIKALLKHSPDGLVPAIVQDANTKQVLMMAWMDDEALKRTLETKKATFWSRSRQEYWVKGETSGNLQDVQSVKLDCDGDTLLLEVIPHGPACHTGAVSCFDTHTLA
jgi:phosphoribosyl-AMP cyclohydrolase